MPQRHDEHDYLLLVDFIEQSVVFGPMAVELSKLSLESLDVRTEERVLSQLWIYI